jgi:hypothetical protein
MIIPPGLTDFEGVPQEDEKLRWEEGRSMMEEFL